MMASATPKNEGAVLQSKQENPFVVKETPYPTLKPDEVLIENHACSINPVDAAMQRDGLIIEKFPAVVGCDAAGKVVEVGANVKDFTTGDRVIAVLDTMGPDGRGPMFGAFQKFVVGHRGLTAKLPDSVSYVEGTVLPLTLSTAATSLYQSDSLELPLPHDKIPATDDLTPVVFIWGGSTSVGACAIQMVRASGFEIATTSSAHNFDFCKSLGAKWVFDHKSESVVDDAVAGLKHVKSFHGGFCSIFDIPSIGKTGEIIGKLGGRQLLGTVVPPAPTIPQAVVDQCVASVPKGVKVCWSKSFMILSGWERELTF